MPTDVLKQAAIDDAIKQGIVDKNNKEQMEWLGAQKLDQIYALAKLAKALGLDAKQALADSKKATPAPGNAGVPAAKASDTKAAAPAQAVAVQGNMKEFMAGFVSMLQKNNFNFGKDGVNIESREIEGIKNTKFLIISGDKANDPEVQKFISDMKAKGLVRDPTAEEKQMLQGGSASPAAQKDATPSPLQTAPRR